MFPLKRGWAVGKRMAFPAYSEVEKNLERPGGRPCAPRPNVVRSNMACDSIRRISLSRIWSRRTPSRRGLRFWIEVGFKALKSVGWQRRKTRRRNPARVERRCPVLSAAPLRSSGRCRLTSVFSRGAASSSNQGRDVARSLASAGAVAAPAGRSGSRVPPQNRKHAPASPSMEMGIRRLRFGLGFGEHALVSAPGGAADAGAGRI